jgi:hypothetical protein
MYLTVRKADLMNNKQETRHTITEGNMARRIATVIFSLIEVMLGFRFFFKLIGANPSNVFVKGLYAFTQFFVGIFEGIFSVATTPGAETEAVFEPATLIAIIVVALIAWAVMKLMSSSSTSQVKRTEVNSGNTEVTTNNPNQNQYNQVKKTEENVENQQTPSTNPYQSQQDQNTNTENNPEQSSNDSNNNQ